MGVVGMWWGYWWVGVAEFYIMEVVVRWWD